MEYIEAKELLENSVRCVAMAMEQIRHRMIDQRSDAGPSGRVYMGDTPLRG